MTISPARSPDVEIDWGFGELPARDKSPREVEAEETSSPEVLRELSTHRHAHVRAAVASNPATPKDVLETLVRDKHHLPRYAVAENPAPTAWAVALGAQDHSVRRILCRNPAIDQATVEILVRDPHREVRDGMAWSSKDPAVLSRLARDDHPGIRAVAALNKALDVADLELLARDRVANVRACAAQRSRRLPEETVIRLSEDRSQYVRYEVLRSHTDRLDLAQKLREDAADLVRDLAADVLDPDAHMQLHTQALVEGWESPWGIP